MANTARNAFTRGLTRQPAIAAPIAAEDRNRKKKHGGDKKKIFSRCRGQIPACDAFAQARCADNAECLAAAAACCDFLGACNFTSFVSCIEGATAN